MNEREFFEHIRTGEKVELTDILDIVRDSKKPMEPRTNEAIVLAELRDAVLRAGELAAAGSYKNQQLLDILTRVGPLCGEQRPFVEACKQLGIQAAQQNDTDRALTYFQACINRAGELGENRNKLSEGLMQYLQDKEMDEALTLLAQHHVSRTDWSPTAPIRRLCILVSAIIDHNAPSAVTAGFALGFKEMGLDVTIVSTEYGKSENSRALSRLRSQGIQVMLLAPGKHSERIEACSNFFHQRKFDAVMWLVTPMDVLARYLGCLRIAPIQAYTNIACEPYAGQYDVIFARNSKLQETHTAWPGKTKFTGNFVTIGPQIDAAAPLSRAKLDVEEKTLIIGTVGRLEKCLAPTYLDAVMSVLQQSGDTVLAMIGPGRPSTIEKLRGIFGNAGLADRIRIYHPSDDEIAGIYKTIDVYCDNCGGQSVIEAMWSGTPIVGWSTPIDEMVTDLIPLDGQTKYHGIEVLIGEQAWIADRSEPMKFANMVLTLLNDPELRNSVGDWNLHEAKNMHSPKTSLTRIIALLNDIARSSTGMPQ